MSDNISLGRQGKRVLKDTISAHKMALLVFIQEYCVGMAQAREMILYDADDVYTEREERELMFLLLKLLQSADMQLKDLVRLLQEAAKPKLVDAILQKLKELRYEGVRAITDLFQTLTEKLFQEPAPLVTKTSVLGLFVRRMILSFDKLSFSQVCSLFKKYRSFYEVWVQSEKASSNGILDCDGSQLGDASLSILEIMGEDDDNLEDNKVLETSMTDAGRYSQRQAEFFIAQQVSLLQFNESEALSPRQLQSKVMELLAGNPDLAEAHYLTYMNALRIREFCGSVDSLFHYFDRLASVGSAGGPPPGNHQPDEDKSGPQYALLNMASLHYRFGHRDEALLFVKEAIRIAQERNDHLCLQHALGWLQRLDVQGTSKSAYLLDRLVTKSSELNLPYLMSLGIQSFSKHNALSSAHPASVFDFLLKSDIINCQSSMSELMCTSYAHKAALWNLYGNREMCSLTSQLLLHLNTQQQSVYHNSEAECLALVHLARLHAQMGDYTCAQLLLTSAKSRFPVNTQHSMIWMLHEQQLAFQQAMYFGKWTNARSAINNMAAIDPLESSYCEVELLKEQGEYGKCLDLVQKLIRKCNIQNSQKQEMPQLGCRLLLLEGALYCSTGNPSEAFQPLLACLTLAKEHHFTYLVSMATLHLAYVQYCLEMPHQASTLLDEVLLPLLTHGGTYDQARAQYLRTRCRVAIAKKKSPEERQKDLQSAVSAMDSVVDSFNKVEAHLKTKDAVYYQARLYHELGCVSERNRCALEFRQLDQQYPTWHKAAVLSL